MNKNKQKIGVLLVFIVSFLVLLVLSMTYSYKLSDFSLRQQGGKYAPVTMPISEQSRSTSVYEVKGQITTGYLTTKKFLFIPDDQLLELKVNGVAIDLSQYPSSALRDYVRGVSIDLKEYLEVGKNDVYARYKDTGGRMGLSIYADPMNTFFVMLVLAWTAFVLAVSYFVIRAFGFGGALTAVLMLALFIRILYFVVTDYNIRGHDTYEHLDYINYFIEHKSLPPVEMSARRVFFHPPLYYVTTAIYASGVEFVTGEKRLVNRAIQGLSIAYSMLFLIFSVKAILLLFSRLGGPITSEEELAQQNLKDSMASPRTKYAWLSCLLLVFWPSTILHSNRIGNDALLYAVSAAALYFLVRFYFYQKKRDSIYFAISVSLGILTKVSAAIFLPVALIVLVKMYLDKKINLGSDLVRLVPIPAIMFAAALSFALYPGVVSKLKSEKDHIYIENINNVHSGLRVPNEPRNYFWFDVKTFMTEAYTSPWEDDKGRVYFWNYLSKTSLFGEWNFADTVPTVLASIVSICFLSILFYTAAALLNIRWLDFSLLFPLLTFFGGMYAAVTYMRATFPVNIDFRYIVPTLICSTIFLNYFLYRLDLLGRSRLALLGVVTQGVFIVGSILFVVAVFFQAVLG